MQLFIKSLGKGQDLALIELQGDLESRQGANIDLSGQFIGDLHFAKDNASTPILIVGHHILYGKIAKLERPMVALKKMVKNNDDGTTTEYQVESVIRTKLIFKSRPKPIIANVPLKA